MCPSETPTHRTPALAVALLVLLVAAPGCVSLKSSDLVPQSVARSAGAPPPEGSVDVRALMGRPRPDGSGPVRISAVLDARMLRDGLSEAIARHGPFAQVSQGGADYVLDVWLELVTRDVQILGEGYVIDQEAIWRLTRVRDGKVLACEAVKGHGASRGFGSNGSTQATGAATRDMIGRGLSMLSDPPASHLSAMATAGLRPSMGEVVPEGLAVVMEKVRQNWSKLASGMTVEEVERLLGPVTSASTAPAKPSGSTLHVSNGLFVLAFMGGKLSFWELRAK